MAGLVGAPPSAIVFTSGATESDNLALLGAARAGRPRGRHLVTSRTEHKAVIDACRQLEREDFDVTWLKPGPDGRITPAQVEDALRPDTLIVSVMHGNNEIGVVNDVAAIGATCRARGVLLHVDAAQGIGKLPVDVAAWDADLVAFTAHKLGGPKGIGALYVRQTPRPSLQPLQFGGGQERGYRPGTLATHQIVGFGLACELARADLPRGGGARPGASREALGGPAAGGRCLAQRRRGTVAAGNPEHRFRRHRGREPAVGAGGGGARLQWLGLQLGLGGAFLRAEGAGPVRPRMPGLIAAQPGPVDPRGGRRPGGGGGGRRRGPPALAGASWRAGADPLMAGPYTDEVRRLCAQPAHAGDLGPGGGSVLVGESAAPERGAWARFAARVVDGRVQEARFRAWGCPHVLAACELAASRLEGHPPGRAGGLSAATLAAALDLPAQKLGRLLVIEDALAALAAAPATSK